MDFFENLLSTLSTPLEIARVFGAMQDIFNALPLVVKFAIVGCFSLSCLFAIMRMLF